MTNIVYHHDIYVNSFLMISQYMSIVTIHVINVFVFINTIDFCDLDQIEFRNINSICTNADSRVGTES